MKTLRYTVLLALFAVVGFSQASKIQRTRVSAPVLKESQEHTFARLKYADVDAEYQGASEMIGRIRQMSIIDRMQRYSDEDIETARVRSSDLLVELQLAAAQLDHVDECVKIFRRTIDKKVLT
jgi:hypothetical protein